MRWVSEVKAGKVVVVCCEIFLNNKLLIIVTIAICYVILVKSSKCNHKRKLCHIILVVPSITDII